MPAVITNRFKVNNAEQFRESLDEPANTVIYFYIGGSVPYDNETSPPSPGSTTTSTEYAPWADMVALKRIYGSDTSHVTKRYNWVSNTVYSEFNDATTNIESDVFYVLTDEYNVYKCLFNNTEAGNISNTTPSTTKPTGRSTSNFVGADGYVWKYMYSITTSDALKFLTASFMPVKYLTADDGSDQWTVQSTATPGAIDVIKVNSVGANYLSAPNVVIVGDGSGATANVTMSANTVVAVNIVNRGSGYTRAAVSIVGGTPTANATATAIIGPIGGHGSNPLHELGGHFLLMNTRLDGNEGGLFNTSNEFRKIGVMRNPTTYGTTNIATSSEYRQTYRYTVSAPSTNFVEDEVVTSGSNTAYVVQWDSGNNHLYTTMPVYKPFANTAAISGGTSGATGTISAISTPGIAAYSGELMYMENRIAIQRSDDQIEDIKLIIQF